MRSKSLNRAMLPTCLYHDVTPLFLTSGFTALNFPSGTVRQCEKRQVSKTLWPVNARIVICCYQNHSYVITNYQKHIWGSFQVEVEVLSLLRMKHIDTGTKTSTGTRFPLWRRRLLDAGRCCFTHEPPWTTTFSHQKFPVVLQLFIYHTLTCRIWRWSYCLLLRSFSYVKLNYPQQ